MNIKFKSITLRNFLSIGNVTQTIKLDDPGITLIMGDNVDLGSSGSRNGTGKTSIVQAICFAIYGISLTNIKRDNLVNKTNQKNMVVSLEFSDGNKKYRIERGRKPAILRLYIDDGLVTDPESNEAQGESKFTQQEIDKIIGISHTLFKQIIALHSKTKPFLNLSDREQREIIEELLGITQLSRKAEELKKRIKTTKDDIKEQEIRIKTITESNNKINSHIADLKFKSSLWDREHEKKLKRLESEIDELKNINIDEEIENHSKFQEWKIIQNNLNLVIREVNHLESIQRDTTNSLKSNESKYEDAKNHICPECNQEIHDGKIDDIKNKLLEAIAKLKEKDEVTNKELDEKVVLLQDLSDTMNILGPKPTLIYSNIDEAYGHQRLLDSITQTYDVEKNTINPYFDQIANLNASGIQDISYEELNYLTKVKDHQEFLYKLLTNKDSFIRQRIIDQNLNFLNNRLNYYLDMMNLPHEVKFNSDLSVDIINLGKEYDFDQLSSGEQNRLVLSLSWSFRDVWETMNNSYNILVIDELIDSGMDSQGMEKALDILNKICIERGKNVSLISHKGELENKVDRILTAQKENGFTSYLSSE